MLKNMVRESNKRKVIDTIFQRLRNKYPNQKVLRFDNDEVKEVSGSSFRNQFDATKFDSEKHLPSLLRKDGFFIVHLGKGNHAFVKGKGFHKFEEIKTIKEWKIGKTYMDKISKSEAQSASTAFNDNIIHDFLFENTNEDLKLHTARRASTSYDFVVDGIPLRTETKLQIELDGIYESEKHKTIACVEVKNQDHEDFEIRQLFSSMKYFEKLRGWQIPEDYNIRLIFMKRIKTKNKDTFKLYEYKFVDKMNPNSIEFVKATQYDIYQD